MSDPGLSLQAEPQVSGAKASDNTGLWDKAPAWRNLAVAASLLTLAAVAIPVLVPGPATISAPSAAPSHYSVAPGQSVAAVTKPIVAPPQSPVSPQPASPALHKTHQAISQPPLPAEHEATAPLHTASLPAQPIESPDGPSHAATAMPDPNATAVAPDLPVGTVIVSPGVLTRVNQHNRHSQGHEWPITITILSPPQHGTLVMADATGPLTSHGITQIHTLKQIFYKSDPGYTGLDTFTYKRTSGDADDPLDGNAYSMTVDVKK